MLWQCFPSWDSADNWSENTFLCRAPSDPSKAAKRPPVAADSEVYKMLQENQESDEPPRQSASFKVLQEILETGRDPTRHSHLPHSEAHQKDIFYIGWLSGEQMICQFELQNRFLVGGLWGLIA